MKVVIKSPFDMDEHNGKKNVHFAVGDSLTVSKTLGQAWIDSGLAEEEKEEVRPSESPSPARFIPE